MDKFSPVTIENIGNYVYELIDPRNDEVFYIGKGSGNRVFQHEKCALNSEDASLKLDTIRDIINSGYKVKKIIKRYGLTESEAFLAESIYIDEYKNKLTNIVSGHHSNSDKDVEEIEILYNCEDIKIIPNDKFVALNVRQSFDANRIYENSKGNWTINPARASKANYILIVYNNIVRAMYTIKYWEKITVQILSKDKTLKDKDKWIFHKDKEIKSHPYLNKDISKIIIFKQNPIKYYNM